MSLPFDPNIHLSGKTSEVSRIQSIVQRLHKNMQRDQVVQQTTDELMALLRVNRVVLYYFYKQWEGRVTFESLSHQKFSILGSTGPDECFNQEYASLYLDGRVSAIANIEMSEIAECHRNFLQDIQVKANLVVPILTEDGLWGLLVAHHCDAPKEWSAADIKHMQAGASRLASAPSVKQA